MAIKPLGIFCYYNKQRFTQFGSMDCANWYGVAVPDSKKGQALYPAMGRKHISFLNSNKLIFTAQPTKIFKSINLWYAVVGTQVFKIDKFYNVSPIGEVGFNQPIWHATLAVSTTVYTMLSDEVNLYVITENGSSVTMAQVTDPLAPGGATTGGLPGFVAAFGNRFVVSQKNTPFFFLSTINLDGTPADYFSFGSPAAPIFAQASGVIGQLAVLHAQLYILCDFTTDVWSNIPTQIPVAGGGVREFPFKLNTSYNFDYGIADPFSLDVDFGRMVWLARNSNGLVSFMSSNGGQPEDISSQAINVLLEQSVTDGLSPFLTNSSNGFLYQYENSIFYRVVAGKYLDFGDLDLQDSANALEYNYNTKTWHRVIELNGERNRIQQHVFFNNKHLVTVEDDPVVYEMAGNIYYNELRNADEPAQSPDAFTQLPMRYELVTGQIYEDDYSEFITDYVEIDFVFGEKDFYKSRAPFANTVYIVAEDSTPGNPIFIIDDESTPDDPTFLITEDSDTPTNNDQHYNDLYKPHVELYISDDGGVTFVTADLREFSPLGAYRWRMRWYELGASRNRCYKLVCVSSAPIVVLGAVQNVRRSSGGAN